MRTLLAAILTGFLVASAGPAAAGDDRTAMAKEAITVFLDAVVQGKDAVAAILAPEYQLMRANGTGYSREDYLATAVDKVKAQPGYSAEGIVGTGQGDLLVARYMLQIDEVIDGAEVRKRAPRLTVFRRIDGVWKVAAHANFGATD